MKNRIKKDLDITEMYLKDGGELAKVLEEIRENTHGPEPKIVIISWGEQVIEALKSNTPEAEIKPEILKSYIEVVEKRPDLTKKILAGKLTYKASKTCTFSQEQLKTLEMGKHLGSCKACFDEMMAQKEKEDKTKKRGFQRGNDGAGDTPTS